MTKSFTALAALSAAIITLSACTPDRATNLPPGKYERTTSSTDDNATTTETDNSTNVTVDEYGNKHAVVKSKTTKDPKGLFNKKTTKSTTEVVEPAY
jgi:hypothetical protein